FPPAPPNAAGVVIRNRTAAGYTHAVLWSRSGGLQELGTLGGVSSGVNAINEAGVVLGSAATADGVTGNGFLIQPRDTNQDGIPDLWFEDVNKDGINDLMRDFKTLGIPFYAASAMNESCQLLSGMQLWDR